MEATGLSADERAAWLGLLAVVELLPGVLDSHLRRELDLTHFDYHVLATLADAADHSLPMTVLAHRTNASLTRLSHAVRRMEDRGLVVRSPSPEDGRVTNARLTAAGEDLVIGATPGHVDTVRRHVLDALTPSQVKQLRCIGEVLRPRLASARHLPGSAHTRKEKLVQDHQGRGRVLQMRLVVEAADYDGAVRFYRDVLGGAQELQIHGDSGEKVTILDVGRATLELSNPAQVEMIDRVEVGRRVSPHLRVAFEVVDAASVTGQLVDGGAELVAPPTVTPWASLNSRLQGPGNLQVTVFRSRPVRTPSPDRPHCWSA